MSVERESYSDKERSTELSARRTGMSFQRTRMSADRTLMSVIRTSLSLIGFGFTIYQFFRKFHDAAVLKSDTAPRHFGVLLVALGITMLVIGIWYHIAFMLGLRRQRDLMGDGGLIHAQSGFPPSMVLIVAILLLLIGFGAIYSMVFGGGLLG